MDMDMDITYLILVGVTVITFSIACKSWIAVCELSHKLWKLEGKLKDERESEETE